MKRDGIRVPYEQQIGWPAFDQQCKEQPSAYDM